MRYPRHSARARPGGGLRYGTLHNS